MTAKERALQGLKELQDSLRRPEEIDGLRQTLMLATAEYIETQVNEIQELKRKSRAKVKPDEVKL